MPRESIGRYTVTSVSIPIDLLDWLDDNVDNRSSLIRELLEEYRASQSSFDKRMDKLVARRVALEAELAALEDEIVSLEESRLRQVEEEDTERTRRLQTLRT